MIVLGVVCGLIYWKTPWIFAFNYIATKLKIIKKDNLLWNEIFAVGFLGGIGFC